MNEPDLPTLAAEQKRWALGAAALFLIAIGFLGPGLGRGQNHPNHENPDSSPMNHLLLSFGTTIRDSEIMSIFCVF